MSGATGEQVLGWSDLGRIAGRSRIDGAGASCGDGFEGPLLICGIALNRLDEIGMRSCRRFSSTSISDQASWVRLRLRTSPLKRAQMASAITTMTTMMIIKCGRRPLKLLEISVAGKPYRL